MDLQIFCNNKLTNLQRYSGEFCTGLSVDTFEKYILPYKELRYSIESIHGDSVGFFNLTSKELINYLKSKQDNRFTLYPLLLDIETDKDTTCNNSFVFWGKACFDPPILSKYLRISYSIPLKEFNYGSTNIR